MPILENLDLNQVPDKELPCPNGFFRFTVTGAPKLEPELDRETKQPTGKKLLAVMFRLQDRIPGVNSLVSTRINFNDQSGKIQLRRLLLSAGMDPSASPLNTDELDGKVVQLRIRQSTVVDKSSGIEKTYANVGDILIPSDPTWLK